MQGIVSTREESGRSPQSFKLGLCLPAPHSSFPVVPRGQPRVVSGSEDPPRLQMLPSELPLHHCVAAPDTAFVLEDALTRTRSGFMDVVVGPKPPGSRCGLAAGTGGNVARLQHPVLSCRQTRAPNFALPSICQQLAACEEQAGSSTLQVAPHGLAWSPAPCCQRWLLGASCTQPPPPCLGCRQVLLLRPSSKAPDEFPSFIYIVTLKVFIDRDRISSGSQHC